jgi:hypothetical protein
VLAEKPAAVTTTAESSAEEVGTSDKRAPRWCVLHDGCRPVSLEDSPCSPEPQEKTQRKTQRLVKSGKEGAEKQDEHRGKIGRIEDQPKMQEEHQWSDADRNDETHQRQHLVTSASYERPDPNNDNPYALRYSLRKHTQQTTRST